MIAAELIDKVRRIEIKTRGLSQQVFAGQYHSAFKGQGMAFSEVREYQYGDPIRNIDWNVTARFNRPFIKVFDEEREFLAHWEAKAAAGGVLSVPPIHAALVERLGRPVPPSTTYRLLARHGWRKVQPDTQHPNRDPVAQEEFKKNSPNCWQPPV